MHDRWTEAQAEKLSLLERAKYPTPEQRGSLAALRLMSPDTSPRRRRIDALARAWADRSERRR